MVFVVREHAQHGRVGGCTHRLPLRQQYEQLRHLIGRRDAKSVFG